METKTHFDLNAAVQNWHQELAAQPELTPEVRRELETHLRDTVAEFQRRGLNDEESFWLARRRAGQPAQLGEEYAKADPMKVWRERGFWVFLAMLAMHIWGTLCSALFMLIFSSRHISHNADLNNYLPSWVAYYLPRWLEGLLSGLIETVGFYQLPIRLIYSVPIIFFVILLRRNRLFPKLLEGRIWLSLLRSWQALAAYTTAACVLAGIGAYFQALRMGNVMHTNNASSVFDGLFFWTNFFSNLISPAILITAIAWVMPKGKMPTVKHC